MGKILVLAEKPSVGKDIANVLKCKNEKNGYIEGDKYIVTWALGHLVTLADPEGYNQKYKEWKMEDLPIIPKYLKTVVIKKSGKQYQKVKTLLERNDVSEIVIATDAGREGELVARWIIEKSGVKKPMKRLWISLRRSVTVIQTVPSLFLLEKKPRKATAFTKKQEQTGICCVMKLQMKTITAIYIRNR